MCISNPVRITKKTGWSRKFPLIKNALQRPQTHKMTVFLGPLIKHIIYPLTVISDSQLLAVVFLIVRQCDCIRRMLF